MAYKVYTTAGPQSQLIIAPNGFRVECINGEVAIANESVARWFEQEIAKGSFAFQFTGERESFKADPLAALKAQLAAEIRAQLLAEMGDMGKATPDSFAATSTTDLASVTSGTSVATITPEALREKLAALQQVVAPTQE